MMVWIDYMVTFLDKMRIHMLDNNRKSELLSQRKQK